VADCKVYNVDIISYACAVNGIIVVAENVEFFQFSNRNLRNIGHEVVGDSLGVLTDKSAFVSTDGVEITEKGNAPTVVGCIKVTQNFFDKELGATINELLLTAYFYSVYELADFPESDQLMISSAIDLRRHMETVADKGFTNHTAWMQCAIPERGSDIFETVKYVVRSSNRFKKDKFMGLYGLPLLNFGYSILPHAASEEIIKIGYSNPYMAMSNIGILKGNELALMNKEPVDAFMSGAVKYKPFVLLTATTYKNVITLSMCVRGNDKDKEIVNKFFDLMEKNINILIK
jgi:NRPS condensation-like uncharacterized protein